MGVFKKIWPDAWSARMEYILNNTLLALLEYPGSTLLGILRVPPRILELQLVVDVVRIVTLRLTLNGEAGQILGLLARQIESK